jgi:hypothetical protein
MPKMIASSACVTLQQQNAIVDTAHFDSRLTAVAAMPPVDA